MNDAHTGYSVWLSFLFPWPSLAFASFVCCVFCVAKKIKWETIVKRLVGRWDAASRERETRPRVNDAGRHSCSACFLCLNSLLFLSLMPPIRSAYAARTHYCRMSNADKALCRMRTKKVGFLSLARKTCGRKAIWRDGSLSRQGLISIFG
jgi:hypothetical protein